MARTALAAETARIEKFGFSPKGTFLVTWQKADSEKLPEGSLRIWRGADVQRSLHCKQLRGGSLETTLAWTADEALLFHGVTNTIKVYDGRLSASENELFHVKCDDLAALSVCQFPETTTKYPLAAFVPEKKAKPASVKVFALTGEEKSNDDSQPVCVKSTFRAQDVSFKWGAGAVLAQTSTDVDATGGSYYGGTGLYLLSAESDFECLVPLPKEGPIADARWEPFRGREFVVVAGAVPAVAALYNAKAEPTYNFGAAHRNTVSWAPRGRFLALCGFGNLAGDVSFWDRAKKKQLNEINIPCAVTWGWSPDSRFFMTATLAPRMNVDNCIRLYLYDGSPVSVLTTRQPLFECVWFTAPARLYAERGPSPAAKDRLRQRQAEKASSSSSDQQQQQLQKTTSGAYVPPAARRAGGSSLAEKIRLERQADFDGPGKARPGSFVGGAKKTVPGMAPAAAPSGGGEAAESRNKKRRDAAKRRKEEAAAFAANGHADKPPPPPSSEEQRPPPEEPQTKEELLKRQKNLKKKLKQSAELQAKVDAGLKPSAEQLDKLQRGSLVAAELAAVDAKLQALEVA